MRFYAHGEWTVYTTQEGGCMGEQILHNIELFFQKFIFVFMYVYDRMPFSMMVILLAGFFTFFAVFNGTVIFPIVYNYFLIPKLEKRIGKRIVWPSMLKYIVFGRFMCPSGLVARDTLMLYFKYKFKGYKGLLKNGVLKDVGYTIDSATKSEIRWSILLHLNMLICAIGLSTVLLMK